MPALNRVALLSSTEMPLTPTTSATPRIDQAIFVTSATARSVRCSAAPSGSWMLTMA